MRNTTLAILARAGMVTVAVLASSAVFAFPNSDRLAPFRQIEVYTEQLVRQSLGNFVQEPTVVGECVLIDGVAVTFAPGVSEQEKQQFLTRFDDLVMGHFEAGSRWTFTSRGSTGSTGNPAILGYSFVPDGTNILGEPGTSNLFQRFNALFGSPAAWQSRFHASFARWGDLTGISYINDPDDGAAFGPPQWGGAGGVAGVRGDVRLAGFNMGNGNVLAYAYFPNAGGDSVMNTHTSINWASATLDYRYLRNVVMHEHGHSIGLGHVGPYQGQAGGNTKLMEPYISLAYDGPQDDDIRGGQWLYGDTYENNDTNATRFDLGTITTTTNILNLSINRPTDPDWWRVIIPPGKALNINCIPVGATYTVGPAGGNYTQINTTAILDLRLRAYAQNGTTLLGTANNHTAGFTETLTSITPPMDNIVHVNIDAVGGPTNVQRYQLQFWLTALTEAYMPTSHSLFRGTHVSGNLASLQQSDNNHYVMQPGFTLSANEDPIMLVVESTARTNTVNTIVFRLEAHTSVPSIRQRIELFNFVTGTYEIVDERSATTTDSIVDVTISSNASRFVQGGSNTVRARIGYRQSGPVFSFPWQALVDQVRWTITYQ